MVTSAAIRFGELTIEPHDEGFAVSGPKAAGEPVSVTCEPIALSAHVRTDNRGRYRPLSGARTMPSGWGAVCFDRRELDAALDAVYPLARTHQAQWRDGTLRVVPLGDVLARQTGLYESVRSLSKDGRELATTTVCGNCVRTPVWIEETLPDDGIPCPEACSVLIDRCRESAASEHHPPGMSAT